MKKRMKNGKEKREIEKETRVNERGKWGRRENLNDKRLKNERLNE